MFNRARVQGSKLHLLRPTLLLLAATCSGPATEPGAAPSPAAGKERPPTVVEAPTAALRAAYIATVQSDAGAEYAFQSVAGRTAGENSGQRLTASLSAAGVRVTPAVAVEAGPVPGLALTLSGLGCAGAVSPVAAVEPQTRRNRAEYVRPAVTEWYVNGPLGLEQGFTLAQPPRCAPATGIELEVSTGPEVTAQLHGSGPAESSYVELLDSSHKTWLRYSDVFASDARGRALSTRLAVVNGRIRLSIDDTDAAYPVTIDPLIWTVQQQLLGGDTAAGDFFGRAVAVSGTTAVVGAFQANLPGKTGAGAAYVFVRSGTLWSEQQKLVAADAAQDAAFGFAVAVSGDTAVIGAPGATAAGKATAGAAYVYVRSGTTWTQQQKLTASDAAVDDELGDSVAIDGDTVLAGADFADVAAKADAGAAYVFVRSGTSWTQQQKLTSSDGSDGDHLGQAVSLSGGTAALGAPYADAAGKTSAGAAYVFVRAGTSWTQQQKLAAADAAADDGLGSAVSLGSDLLLAGAPTADAPGKADAGAAYVFVRAGTSWTQQQKLAATAPAAGDGFGGAVAVSGSTALISADAAGGSGAVYVFTRAAMTFTPLQSLTSPMGAKDGSFGRGLAIDGDNAVAGAPFSTISGKTESGVAFALVLGMPKGNGLGCGGGVECLSGFCVDGVCCNTACGAGAADCQACSVAAGAASDGTCATAKSGSECRASAGACDVAETCDGVKTTCPTDSVKASTTMCRAASGLCDVAEYCTGASAACPTDNLKPSGSECRTAIGLCDVAETCSGISGDCPADSFKANTTECRAAAGVCDLADFCTGSGPSCPADQFKAGTTPCRAAAGACDAEELCTGTSAACPADAMKKSGTECRAAVGPCDAVETCSGASADCPADFLKPNTAVCRLAADLCDSAEFCSGTSSACPTDQFKPSMAECRPAAGPCDVAEFCSGVSPSCPANDFKPKTTPCRAAAGSCDAEELCSGSEAACPQDRGIADGTACTGGTCQVGQCRQEADLAVALQASPPTAHGQDPVTAQITLTNLSATPATGIKVRVAALKGTLADSGSQGWTCGASDTGLLCERPRQETGAAPSLSIQVIPPLGDAAFSVSAQAAANEFDPNLTNNSATVQIQNESPMHEGGCAMARGRAASPAPAAAGLLLALVALARRRRLTSSK